MGPHEIKNFYTARKYLMKWKDWLERVYGMQKTCEKSIWQVINI